MSDKVVKFPGQNRIVKAPKSYRMQTKKDNGEIYLYGPVGMSWWDEGITASQFQKDLKAMGDVKNIDIRINSEGGDVFDGRTIYSLLMDHKATKTVYVDGLAASIASLIAMAGKDRIMADGAFMMIHNAWGVSMGDSKEMRRMADLLDSVSNSIADTYASRSGTKKSEIQTMMDEETWMDSKQCMDTGFCTKVADPVAVAASITRPDIYRHLPVSLQPRRAKAMALIAKSKKS